jgi:hypothetical protein
MNQPSDVSSSERRVARPSEVSNLRLKYALPSTAASPRPKPDHSHFASP